VNPDQKIKQALKDVQKKLRDYIEPGERDCEEALNQIADIADHNDVGQAVIDSDRQEQPSHGDEQTDRRRASKGRGTVRRTSRG